MPYRWRERSLCVDQVANGPDSGLNLAPASQAPAQAVRDAWAPFLPGQDVPLLWEKVTPDRQPDDCC